MSMALNALVDCLLFIFNYIIFEVYGMCIIIGKVFQGKEID